MKKFYKKLIVTSIIIIIVSSGASWWITLAPSKNNVACAFCDPNVIQTHMFYEDAYVRGLCTYKPLQPEHCLIVVKRHIEKFEAITDKEMLAISKLIKKINLAVQKMNGPSAYLLLQKNGREVGQSVPHVHVHYIPKKESSNKLALWGMLWNFVVEPFTQPMSHEKLAGCVAKMRQALSEQAIPHNE